MVTCLWLPTRPRGYAVCSWDIPYTSKPNVYIEHVAGSSNTRYVERVESTRNMFGGRRRQKQAPQISVMMSALFQRDLGRAAL